MKLNRIYGAEPRVLQMMTLLMKLILLIMCSIIYPKAIPVSGI